MTRYLIESLKVIGLWGYRDLELSFNRDVNILVGPNASGKTTLLNILHHILTADLQALLDIPFSQVVIKLKDFEGKSVRTIKVIRGKDVIAFIIGQNRFEIVIESIPESLWHQYRYIEAMGEEKRMLKRIGRRRMPEGLYEQLTSLVPTVWLPVSRRLPIREEEEEAYLKKSSRLESVDWHLRVLLQEVFNYHSGLNALLSRRYKDFENQVLSVILYSKTHDQIGSIPSSPPTKDEKEQLLRAFEAAGLLDSQMQKRIDEHFSAAEEALKRFSKGINMTGSSRELNDLFIIPLIKRTKAMVDFARELESDRESIFKPLRRYEETVNSFLHEKSVKVDEDGALKIESPSSPELKPDLLSSGEKQILILLTQALLMADKPVVYIADEPELSLHVSWQEKLLKSLIDLGGQMQVIVATHSPDIVGNFIDKVIDLGRKN